MRVTPNVDPTARTAGRALDAEIAEKVMGFAWEDAPPPSGRFLRSPEGWPAAYVPLDSDTTTWTSHLPAYSTEIAAAWLVVERMRDHAPTSLKNLHLVAYCYNRTYASFDAGDIPMMDGPLSAEGNGEHATPLAICLAALATTVAP